MFLRLQRIVHVLLFLSLLGEAPMVCGEVTFEHSQDRPHRRRAAGRKDNYDATRYPQCWRQSKIPYRRSPCCQACKPGLPGVGRVQKVVRLPSWGTSCFGMAPFFVRTILRTTKGTYCTLGGRGQTPVFGTPLLGCAAPPDQSPAEALLGASGK